MSGEMRVPPQKCLFEWGTVSARFVSSIADRELENESLPDAILETDGERVAVLLRFRAADDAIALQLSVMCSSSDGLAGCDGGERR